MLIHEMNEQELVNFATGDIQSACNIVPIANALVEVTRRLRFLQLNGNDHIAIRWLCDKLYSLVDRECDARNHQEQNLIAIAFKR